jgi:gamma-glutamylcysteine synthetase
MFQEEIHRLQRAIQHQYQQLWDQRRKHEPKAEVGTVEFDLAAQIGRNMGEARCQQLYNRCDTSTEDMVKMIRTEFENLKELQKDLDNSVDAEAQMKKEKDDLMKEFKDDKIDLDKNWNWA